MKIVSNNEVNTKEIPMKKIVQQILQLCEKDPIFDRTNRMNEMELELEELIPKYRKALDKENEVTTMFEKIKKLISETKRKNDETKERLIEELGGEI